MFNKWKYTRKDNDWARYKCCRNEYKTQLDQAEEQYTTMLSETLASERNSMTWWKTSKWLLGKVLGGGEEEAAPVAEETTEDASASNH